MIISVSKISQSFIFLFLLTFSLLLLCVCVWLWLQLWSYQWCRLKKIMSINLDLTSGCSN